MGHGTDSMNGYITAAVHILIGHDSHLLHVVISECVARGRITSYRFARLIDTDLIAKRTTSRVCERGVRHLVGLGLLCNV